MKQTAATCQYKTDINNSNNPQATRAGDADEMVMLDAAADSCGIQSNQRNTRIHTVQRVSELVGFNVPINTSYVFSQTSLSSQSLAPVLTT